MITEFVWKFRHFLAKVIMEAIQHAIAQSNFTCTNVDIINAQVPGYQGLQQICVDSQGIISQICQLTLFSSDCLVKVYKLSTLQGTGYH
jgi:hypothetical protein